MLIGIFSKQIKKFSRESILLIFIPLILSAFTHLWNPIGFPAMHVDEGHYMRRTMQVLEGLGPQESNSTYFYPYDHPYFGQLFLASLLKIVGYPDSLSPKVGDVHSIEMLYLVPRILMGLLSVVDTFLIYKIAERRYSKNVAFIAAILFAVMPSSLLTRGILLDCILLPFLLASILFALYSGESDNINKNGQNRRKKLLVLISGIFLGLSIFTKVPIITMIPLIAFIILKNSNKNPRMLMLWFIPVILIPMIWPVYTTSTGHFDEWINGVLYQTSRESGKDLRYSVNLMFIIDPVLLILAVVGFIYSELKGSYFIFLWVVPYLIFLSLLGWVVHFHWIIFLPVFCILAGILIEDLSKRIRYHRLSHISRIVAISSIGIFGLISTTILISSNLNSAYFELYSFTVKELQDNVKLGDEEKKDNNGITVIGSHRVKALLWIPEYVFHNDKIFWRDTDIRAQDLIPPVETKKMLLMVDPNLRNRLVPYEIIGNEKDRQISLLYHDAQTIATFINRENNRYSYMGMQENYALGSFTEIRANY